MRTSYTLMYSPTPTHTLLCQAESKLEKLLFKALSKFTGPCCQVYPYPAGTSGLVMTISTSAPALESTRSTNEVLREGEVAYNYSSFTHNEKQLVEQIALLGSVDVSYFHRRTYSYPVALIAQKVLQVQGTRLVFTEGFSIYCAEVRILLDGFFKGIQ